jgi:hypothetical protein
LDGCRRGFLVKEIRAKKSVAQKQNEETPSADTDDVFNNFNRKAESNSNPPSSTSSPKSIPPESTAKSDTKVKESPAPPAATPIEEPADEPSEAELAEKLLEEKGLEMGIFAMDVRGYSLAVAADATAATPEQEAAYTFKPIVSLYVRCWFSLCRPDLRCLKSV